MNGRGKDKGIRDKGRDNGRDSRGKAQSFIYTSDVLFADNSINRKSSQGYINNNSLLNVRFGSLLGPHGLLLVYIWGENSI